MRRPTILVTGGAGFIGSNFVRFLRAHRPEYRVVVLDKLTYAGRRENLAGIPEGEHFRFVQGDIAEQPLVDALFAEERFDLVVNFAAETHVDRSILEAGEFIRTDIWGTWVLLEVVRRRGTGRFLQVSTDEVYGQILEGSATEADPLAPRSPYAASKAGADLMALAYHETFGLPILITRGSNTFGPYQYPEKFIPLFITNALDDEPLPLYGDGRQVRDWIYVVDHCAAIDLVLHKGEVGRVYNVGAGNERQNIEVARLILRLLGKPESLIRPVADRPAHDRRYSLDTSRLRALGWAPRYPFEEALAETVRWYRANEGWWRPLKQGEFAEFYRRNYGHRLGG